MLNKEAYTRFGSLNKTHEQLIIKLLNKFIEALILILSIKFLIQTYNKYDMCGYL